MATVGVRWVESSAEEKPTTQVVSQAACGGRHADEIGPGNSTWLIEGEVAND